MAATAAATQAQAQSISDAAGPPKTSDIPIALQHMPPQQKRQSLLYPSLARKKKCMETNKNRDKEAKMQKVRDAIPQNPSERQGVVDSNESECAAMRGKAVMASSFNND